MHFVFLYFCFAYMCSYLAQWVDIFDIFVTLTLSTVNSFSIVLEPWGWNNHKYIFEHSLWQYLECNLANLAHFAPSISSGAIKYKVHLYLWNLLWNVALGDNFPSSKFEIATRKPQNWPSLRPRCSPRQTSPPSPPFPRAWQGCFWNWEGVILIGLAFLNSRFQGLQKQVQLIQQTPCLFGFDWLCSSSG